VVGPKRNRADLGFYPASAATEPGNWDPSTDGIKLLANALLYTIRPKVLLAAADHPPNIADVQAKILSTGTVGPVDVFDARDATPTLEFLQRYDAVMTWTNPSYNNSTAMGNVLADYVDAGGGVVSAVFANTEASPAYRLGGRWLSGGYEIIPGGFGTIFGPATTLGGGSIPGHPIMGGVASFNGNSFSSRPFVTTLNPGGLKVAQWSDGKTLVAVSTKMYNRADLGFYPVSSAINVNNWDASTDGAKLMANALRYVSKPYVGLVTADSAYAPDLRSRLLASLRFSGVGIFDADAASPPLATLSPFSGMMTWSNAAYADSTAFGNTAANYVDAGGAVVSAVYANVDSTNPIYRPGGRWITEGYETVPSPLPPYAEGGAPTLGAIHEPLNPVARFVRKFIGSGLRPRLATTPLLRGRTILEWTDGAMLASIHTFRKRVDLGFWPVANGGYDPASDAVWLAANALDYAVRHKPCPGDFNGDGIVEDTDFVLFVAYYNDLLDPRGDLNGDGLTEDADFVIFVAAYDALVCP